MVFSVTKLVQTRLAVVALSLAVVATPALADFTTAAYRLAVAEAVQSDNDLASFYKEYEYQPLWTGRNREDRDRRAAFFDIISASDFHGLPEEKYGAEQLKREIKDARTQADLAALEVSFSKAFLTFAAISRLVCWCLKKLTSKLFAKFPTENEKAI